MCHFSYPTCKAYLPITANNKLSLMNKWSRETSITEHELFIPVNPLSMLNFVLKASRYVKQINNSKISTSQIPAA